MSFSHGKSAVVKLDNPAGSITAITSYCNKSGFNRSADVAETTVMGLNSKTYVPGLKDATFSIEGYFDGTDDLIDEILDAALGAQKSIEWGPQGSTSGYVKYTFEAICTAYTPGEADLSGAVPFTAEFQVTGDVTRTTWA